MIDTIMIFAAGKGTRMKHITANQPKSLISILGKPILQHILELVISSRHFKKIVINAHYLSSQIEDFMRQFIVQNPNCPEIVMIHETELLETGGAIKNASALIGNKPIFTMNSDVIIECQKNIFVQLEQKWDPIKMDFLLMLQPFGKAFGYRGVGDFEMEKDGKLYRSSTKDFHDYMYAGISILKPQIINENPNKIFSLKEYYLNSNRVYGKVVNNCNWYHASTPEDIDSMCTSLHESKSL